MHTADGEGYGQGNCGRDGLHKFLCSHRCNEICKDLGLRQCRIERVDLTVTCQDGDGMCVDRWTPRAVARTDLAASVALLLILRECSQMRPDSHCGSCAVPGTRIERCLEGPDGQLHDWVVPAGARPGSDSTVRVLSVAAEDRAMVAGGSSGGRPGTPPSAKRFTPKKGGFYM